MTPEVRCRQDPSEGASSAWLTLHEAAAYLRMTASGIRSLISRAEIVPDGRGSRRIAMFRRSTLDASSSGALRSMLAGGTQCPGLEALMRRTKYPGVHWLSGGRYRVRFVARDPKTGREKEIKKVIEATSDSAAMEVRLRLMRAAASESQRGERVRLSDYAESWLRTKLPELKASTADKYATMLDLHILPALGDYFIDAIMPADVLKWRDQQDAKPGTVNTRLRVLRTLLADAASDLDLPRSPAERTHAVRDRRDREADPNTLDAEQLAKVLGYFHEHEPAWHPLFLALALTGARFGEVSALHWDDVDPAAKVIRIRRAQWKGIEGDTKTGSRPTVPLPDLLAKVLEGHRRVLLAAQSPGLARGLVFPTTAGKLYRVASLRKPLSRALAAAGVEHRFSVHGFRRTFNNLLRQVASGEVVRSMTGHVTERMTEHYSHVSHSEKRAALDTALLSLTAFNAVSSSSTAVEHRPPDARPAGTHPSRNRPALHD